MKTGTTGTGGTTTTGTGTTTNTGKPTTPFTTSTKSPTPPPSPTATPNSIVNNKNVIRGATGGGGSGTYATAPAQPTNNFITYVNAVNKITIRYPSIWTKTEFAGNPSIPVMFNAPFTTTATPDTGAAKTSFMISITPSAANLDSFTSQQIFGLTHSNTIKYTITNPDAKVLTAPTGITAFREISYDAIKNIIVNNNIPTQVPLKGTAIFFVNGGTGYSLLYLAKQTEYTQNLPMIQQMMNSFHIGSGGPIQKVAANSSPR
jgi:hypothetical protein